MESSCEGVCPHLTVLSGTATAALTMSAHNALS
jgi:hypothetical protein